MDQPDGVLHLEDAFLYASDQEWPGKRSGLALLPGQGYDWSEACPLEMHRAGSLQISGSDLEVNQNGQWVPGASGLRTANITGSTTLNIRETCVEMQASIHIGGAGEAETGRGPRVSWDGDADGYSSNTPHPIFEIGHGSTGSLLLRDATWARPVGWGLLSPTPFVERQIAAGAAPAFAVTLINVYLYDFSFDVTAARPRLQPQPAPDKPVPASSGYQPLARGVDLDAVDVQLLTHVCTAATSAASADPFCSTGTSVVYSNTRIRPGRTNLLAGVIDVSGATLPTHPVPATDTLHQGGWEVRSCDACVFVGIQEDLPSLVPTAKLDLQQGVAQCMPPAPPSQPQRGVRLDARAASGGDGVTALSVGVAEAHAFMVVEPSRQYVLSGWVRTNGVGQIAIGAEWFRIDKTRSTALQSTPTQPLNASAVGFDSRAGGSMWEQLLIRLESSADAALGRLELTAQDGALLDLYALQLKTCDEEAAPANVWFPPRCVFSQNVSAPAEKAPSKEYDSLYNLYN